MRLVLLSVSLLALAVACGSSPEPKSDAPAEGAAEAAPEGPRPIILGCGSCLVEVCYDAANPERLGNVKVNLQPTADGEPLVGDWQAALLELEPESGGSQGLALKTDAWKDSGPIMASVKDPKLQPATGGWTKSKATLTLTWKKGEKTHSHKFGAKDGLRINVMTCK